MPDPLKAFWKSPRSSITAPKNRGIDGITDVVNHNAFSNLERLISDNPQFHLYNGELTNSWSVQVDTLRYIHSLLAPGQTTPETGCGQTTVVFAIVGTKHLDPVHWNGQKINAAYPGY